jgi:hypothetical protein
MKCNPWTLGLLSAGLVSLPAICQAEEKPSSVLTALSATTLSGYVDTSAQWNPGTGNANVPGYFLNSPTKSDGFNLNVVELNLEKPTDAADAWGAGYKFSMLAGPDASTFNTKSPSATANSDFAVKQAYVALHAPVGNGLDFKIGVWDTLIGYEVFESINNPNVTRSYGYTMEPTTHTGIQATYQVCETVSVSGGIADSFGATINGRAFFGPVNTATGVQGPQAESYKTYMGAMTFTAPTNSGFLSGSTLSACVINGYNAAVGVNGADQTSFYVGGTINTPVTGLKAGACYDYAAANLQPVPGSSTESSAYAHALGLYASYQVNEKLSVYGRGEYAASSGAVPGTAAATYPGASIVGWGPKNVYELTGTVQYDLWKNVLSRFEVRWDHAEHGLAYAGTTAGNPMGENYITLLADFSYKF